MMLYISMRICIVKQDEKKSSPNFRTRLKAKASLAINSSGEKDQIRMIYKKYEEKLQLTP